MTNIVIKDSRVENINIELKRVNLFIGPSSFTITRILSQILKAEQEYLENNKVTDLCSSDFGISYNYNSDWCNIEVTRLKTWYTRKKEGKRQSGNISYVPVSRDIESIDINTNKWGDEYMPALPILSKVKKGCSHLIIDEPEQGLLPSTQRNLLKYLISNLSVKNSLTIATSSPYIVYTLNNCMLAGSIENQDVTVGINSSDVGMWLLKDRSIKPLQNTEDGLLACDIFNEEFQKIHSEMFQLLKLK